MNNRIEETTFPAGTTLRVGQPADRPQEAINELVALFSTKGNVIYAGLGLMEVVQPKGASEFSYTIGLECSCDPAEVIKQASAVLRNVPTGRWPITFVPARSQFFPKDVQPFFGEIPERSWIHRLLYFDLNSLWKKRRQ